MAGAVVAFLVLMLVVGVRPLAAMEATQILEAVTPSLVVVDDAGSVGSGMFLNDKGTILTSYRAVALNLELKVRARIKIGGRIQAVELKDVKVVKVHKDYDLATLQVTLPANAVSIPAKMIPGTPPLGTGIKCYVLGIPAESDGRTLDFGITGGVVSAALRKADNLDYVQTSAPIHREVCGGPVCNELGQVIGIAALRMEEAEGIGFAVSAQKLSSAGFVEPKDKVVQPDVGLSMQAFRYAHQLFTMPAAANERPKVLQASVDMFRVALVADPTNGRTYGILGKVYQELGKLETARKCAETGLRISPRDPECSLLLGKLMMQADPKNKELAVKCVELWLQAVGNEDADNLGRAHCAGQIALAMQVQGNLRAAAYMMYWSSQIFETDEMRELWEALREKMPPADFAAFGGRKSGFSKEEFANLAKTGPSVAPAVAPAGGNSALPGLTAEQMAKLASDAAAQFSPSQVPVPPEGLICDLPFRTSSAQLAYCGWALVINSFEAKQVGIFNLATAQMEGVIDYPKTVGYNEGIRFAVGGQVLAVYSINNRTIDLYDLATRAKFASKTMAEGEPVDFIGMGLLNPSRLFVLQRRFIKGRGEFFFPSFLRVPDLSATELSLGLDDRQCPLRATWSWSKMGGMDETGTIAAFGNDTEPASEGLCVLIPRPGNKMERKLSEVRCRHIGVAQGGRFAVSSKCLFDAVGGKEITPPMLGSAVPHCFAPVAGAKAIVSIERNHDTVGFRILSLPEMTTTAQFSVPPSISEMIYNHDLKMMPSFDTLVASANSNRIAYIVPEAKKLILFPLSNKDGKSNSGDAEPGKPFRRKLTIPAGATVAIKAGPDGMKYDEATGSLHWDVPADCKSGQTLSVIMTIKDADEKERFLIEKILVH